MTGYPETSTSVCPLLSPVSLGLSRPSSGVACSVPAPSYPLQKSHKGGGAPELGSEAQRPQEVSKQHSWGDGSPPGPPPGLVTSGQGGPQTEAECVQVRSWRCSQCRLDPPAGSRAAPRARQVSCALIRRHGHFCSHTWPSPALGFN